MKYGLATARVPAWSRVRAFGSVGALALALGCSSSPASSSSAVTCGAVTCGPGSDCIDDGSGPRCQKVCTQQADCPFNWFCNDGQPKSWCAAGTYTFTKQAGQWGAPCPPGAGENNPLCDAAEGFGCYGTSPTDAYAMCTILDCTKDSDCAGGWWCATVDVAPNLASTQRTFGKTRKVCIPRRYCDSCKLDHDCPLAADKTQQHCMQDSNGGRFCSPQCATGSNCALDATCTAMPWGVCTQKRCATDGDCPATQVAEACVGGVCQTPCVSDADCPASNGMHQHCSATRTCVPKACASDDDCPPTRGTFQHCNAGTCTPECAADKDCNPAVGDQTCVPLSMCMPRAGVCKGAGNFCDPCGSDADCTNGYCLVSPYSKERFCSQAMMTGTTCSGTTLAPGSCPTRPTTANYKGVSCTTAVDAAMGFSPADQCIGGVTFGMAQGQVQYVPGCWTANR